MSNLAHNKGLVRRAETVTVSCQIFHDWHHRKMCWPFVICNFWHPGTLTLRAERQSARMSKTTNDGLTRSGTGCFIAVPMWQQWTSKGYR